MLFEEIFIDISKSLISTGAKAFAWGVRAWEKLAALIIEYLSAKDVPPASGIVSASSTVWALCLAVGAALTVLFFAMSLADHTTDFRAEITAENLIRLFLKLAISMILVTNSFAIASGTFDVSAALVAKIGLSDSLVSSAGDLVETYAAGSGKTTEGSAGKTKSGKTKSGKSKSGKTKSGKSDAAKKAEQYGYFLSVYQDLTEDDASLKDWLAAGGLCLAGGVIGGVAVMICGIRILVAVVIRLIRMLLCIPLAPLAFSTSAGGREMSRSAWAWARSFAGYAVQAPIIAIALNISFRMFSGALIPDAAGESDVVRRVLMLLINSLVPMLAASECSRGADRVAAKYLGL